MQLKLFNKIFLSIFIITLFYGCDKLKNKTSETPTSTVPEPQSFNLQISTDQNKITPKSDFSPETKKFEGLLVNLWQGGKIIAAATSNNQGQIDFSTSLSKGNYLMEFPSENITIPVNIDNQTLNIQGIISEDTQDVDQDGNKTENLLNITIIPDTNGDNISDDTSKTSFLLTQDGGKGDYLNNQGTKEETKITPEGETTVQITNQENTTPDNPAIGPVDTAQIIITHDLYLVAPHNSETENTRFRFSGNCDDCHLIQINDQGKKGIADDTSALTDLKVGDNNPKGTICLSCHKNDLQKTYQPLALDHEKANYSKSCKTCHGSGKENWTKGIRLTHPQNSGYLLEGIHSDTTKVNPENCQDCHQENRLKGFTKLGKTMKDCFTCHSNLYNSATKHQSGKYNQNCLTCHSNSAWKPANLDHKNISNNCESCHTQEVPIAHNNDNRTTLCETCHSFTAKWTFTHPQENCFTCHNNIYTTAPDHQTKKYSQDCRLCHGLSAWKPATFNHKTITNNCVSCHQLDTPSAHNANNRNTLCETCHAYPDWAKMSVDHNQITSGCERCHQTIAPASHATNDFKTGCEKCHSFNAKWTFDHTQKTCTVCHNNLYNTAPLHQANNFNKDCNQCHLTSAWKPALFDHKNASKGCEACHLKNIPASHTTANYKTGCEQCHSFSAKWAFNHTAKTSFPVNHEGSWTCTDCHANNNYQNGGGCIECHRRYGEKTHETSSNKGCLGCHSNGSGEGEGGGDDD